MVLHPIELMTSSIATLALTDQFDHLQQQLPVGFSELLGAHSRSSLSFRLTIWYVFFTDILSKGLLLVRLIFYGTGPAAAHPRLQQTSIDGPPSPFKKPAET